MSESGEWPLGEDRDTKEGDKFIEDLMAEGKAIFAPDLLLDKEVGDEILIGGKRNSWFGYESDEYGLRVNLDRQRTVYDGKYKVFLKGNVREVMKGRKGRLTRYKFMIIGRIGSTAASAGDVAFLLPPSSKEE